MGERAHEIPRWREARDYPAGGAIAPADPADAGQDRHTPGDILSLVRSLSLRRPRSSRRRSSGPDRAWNRIPEEVQGKLVDLALEEPDLSPRELAVRFTDTEKYFVSEVSAYRLLKAHD